VNLTHSAFSEKFQRLIVGIRISIPRVFWWKNMSLTDCP